MLFKLSNLNSNLALTLGYLNLALNNSDSGISFDVISVASIPLFTVKDIFLF